MSTKARINNYATSNQLVSDHTIVHDSQLSYIVLSTHT